MTEGQSPGETPIAFRNTCSPELVENLKGFEKLSGRPPDRIGNLS
jgi:hypothetical protein